LTALSGTVVRELPTPAEAQTRQDACRPDKDCPESWGFGGTITLSYLITYVKPKNSRHPSGVTLEQHEWEHIGDIESWCETFTKSHPSDGFKTLKECSAARDRIYKDFRKSLEQAEKDSTKTRD
jgi:hypothetical protein